MQKKPLVKVTQIATQLTKFIAFSFLLGCQTFGNSSPESNWQPLHTAQDVSCNLWPKAESQALIHDLQLLEGQKTAIMATTRSSSNQRLDFYTNFLGDKSVSSEDLKKIILPESAIIIKSIHYGNTSQLALFSVDEKGKSLFQLRKIPENIVTFTDHYVFEDVRSGDIQRAGNRFWLLVENEENFDILTFAANAPNKQSLTMVSRLQEEPKLLPSFDNKKMYAVSYENYQKKKSFVIRSLESKNAARMTIKIPIQITQLESWDIIQGTDQYYLAFVEGDSLSGQAKLTVAAFSTHFPAPPKISYRKSVELNDVHVSDPVFLSQNGRIYIQLMQWLDNESTISLFAVDKRGISQPHYHGVFPRGTGVIETFAFRDQGVYSILRKRETNKSQFYTCRLEVAR